MALLRKMTCNLRHHMCLRHSLLSEVKFTLLIVFPGLSNTEFLKNHFYNECLWWIEQRADFCAFLLVGPSVSPSPLDTSNFSKVTFIMNVFGKLSSELTCANFYWYLKEMLWRVKCLYFRHFCSEFLLSKMSSLLNLQKNWTASWLLLISTCPSP